MGHMCSVMCRGLFECPTCQPLSSDAYLKTRCLLFARIASWHRFGKMWSTALKFPLIQYVTSYLSGLCCGRKRSQRKEKRPKTCRRNCRKPLQCRLVSCHWCGWIISLFIPAVYTIYQQFEGSCPIFLLMSIVCISEVNVWCKMQMPFGYCMLHGFYA